MNRKIKIITLLLIILTTLIIPFTITNAIETIKVGDINLDGNINTIDLIKLIRHISAEESNKREEWKLKDLNYQAADINNDGQVNQMDVLYMIRYLTVLDNPEVAVRHKNWIITRNISINSEKQKQETKATEENKNTEKQDNTKETIKHITVKSVPTTPTHITVESVPTTPIHIITKTVPTVTTSTVKQNIQASSIKLNKTSLTLEKGKTAKLVATISPNNTTNKNITWTSSDSKIASVKNGEITAKKVGKVTITAKTSNGKTAKATITVKETVKLNTKNNTTKNTTTTKKTNTTTAKTNKVTRTIMNIPYYNQWPGSGGKYNGSSIASDACEKAQKSGNYSHKEWVSSSRNSGYACGAFSTAMCLAYCTGKDVDPGSIGRGVTVGGVLKDRKSDYGVNVRSYSLYDFDLVKKAILDGNPVVMYTQANDAKRRGVSNPFTNGAHFFVLKGYDSNKKEFYVNNPSKPQQLNTAYSEDTIKKCVSYLVTTTGICVSNKNGGFSPDRHRGPFTVFYKNGKHIYTQSDK